MIAEYQFETLGVIVELSESLVKWERRHSEMSWMSFTDDGCEIPKNEKEGAGYRPKDPKVGKPSKKTKRKEQDRPSTSNTALEEGQASLPDIPYLSEPLNLLYE